ncbi:hypothetical protein BZA05DRAFT_422849 [Tricharina praecox]|uniref:uncharacterized protein n=1 Tax=Tricharina praecox TaxID=43433 RepID=UPI00221F9B61|nr:uncharacterized protein BZA05DRAFT_422849 [Tricharina praecox]KAI5841311.1 hypothetical protein BZA05DRAFT_422849 [Tricharina praecox]
MASMRIRCCVRPLASLRCASHIRRSQSQSSTPRLFADISITVSFPSKFTMNTISSSSQSLHNRKTYVVHKHSNGFVEFSDYIGQALEPGEEIIPVPAEIDFIQWAERYPCNMVHGATLDTINYADKRLPFELYKHHHAAKLRSQEDDRRELLRAHIANGVKGLSSAPSSPPYMGFYQTISSPGTPEVDLNKLMDGPHDVNNIQLNDAMVGDNTNGVDVGSNTYGMAGSDIPHAVEFTSFDTPIVTQYYGSISPNESAFNLGGTDDIHHESHLDNAIMDSNVEPASSLGANNDIHDDSNFDDAFANLDNDAAFILAGMKDDHDESHFAMDSFMDVDAYESQSIGESGNDRVISHDYDLSGATLVEDNVVVSGESEKVVGKNTDEIAERLAVNLHGNRTQSNAVLLKSFRDNFTAIMPVMGPHPNVVCWMCLHPGHDDPNDLKNCPVARLQSYIYHDFDVKMVIGTGSADEPDAIDFFFVDMRCVEQSLKWAISLRGVEGTAEFGVKSATIGNLESLLFRCKSLAEQGWIVGQEGIPEHLFAQDLVISDQYAGNYADQMDDCLEVLPLKPYPDHMMLNTADYFQNTGNAAKLQAAAKRNRSRAPPKKKVQPCDTAGLPTMGDRIKAVCARCCYRGHVVNSTKTCPFAIALEAVQKYQAGQKYETYLDKYECAIADLRLIVSALNEENDDRAESIEELIQMWDDMRKAGPAKKNGRGNVAAAALALKRKRDASAVDVPDMIAAMQIPVFPSSYYDFLKDTLASSPLSFLKLKDEFLIRFPAIGLRPDTQCPNCLMFGHDHRYKSCLLLQARQAVNDGSIVNTPHLHGHLRQLASSAAFFENLPEGWKQYSKKTDVIRNFFGAVEGAFRDAPASMAPPAAAIHAQAPVQAPPQKRQRQNPAPIQSSPAYTATGAGNKYAVVDISRMDGEMVADLTDFFLDVDVENGIAIDHSKMTNSHFRRIMPFLVR